MDTEKFQDWIKQHMWGPIGSCVIHVVIVGMLLAFAGGQAMEAPPEVEITMVETKTAPLEKIPDPEPVKPVKPVEQQPQEVDRPEDVAVVSTIDVPSDAPGTGGMGNLDGAGIGSGEASLPVGFEVANNNSPFVLKGLFATRTAGGRSGAMRRHGGSLRGETSVLRALRWLKANQDADGSWSSVDKNSAPAMAGLALLCYLAHNETPSSVEFGATVEKAMKYIVSKQGSDGVFGTGKNAYVHGICTYAISEAYGLTKIMALKESMDKGITVIIEGQQTDGGYDYGYKSGPRWDLSVAGWQFQALKAAKMAGASNENLEGAIEKGMNFLQKVAHQSGQGFGYATPKSTVSMTGAGVLCLQLLGKYDAAEAKSGLKWLNTTKHKDLDLVWDSGEGAKNPLYAWYYITQAKFQKQGDDWKEWNPKFSKMLAQSQIITGANKELGHWENGDWGVKDGPVYATTLCCLMLEVYYRYLPTFMHVETPAAASAPKPASGDIDMTLKPIL